MLTCSSCAATVDSTAAWCPRCGARLDSVETRMATTSPPPRQETPSTTPKTDGFTAGDLLGGRYRIVGLLGRGGMGEVYRADDLELQQVVALKFLPATLDRDPERLDRLRAEVRTARLISHPNVCRVFDIGLANGRHFLTMEYVDGEDLASLLRRIGRLPADKGLDVARQLCAGLAAAHNQQVIHRDLKPANVMLDGRGRVRINDFGLAVVGDNARPGDWAGTPAYMAPEQFANGELSARTDVYALGLVLFEIFTGRRLLDAKSVDQLRKLQSDAAVLDDSASDVNLDPALERLIKQCIALEPARRPESAMVVARALPGSDPLAAALAAGETPSPSLVAASGDEVVANRPVALGVLAAFLICLVLTGAVNQRQSVFAALRPAYSPDVLSNKAVEMLGRLGYTEIAASASVASGFDVTNLTVLENMLADERAPLRFDRVSRLRPAVVRFWHRTSPFPLTPIRFPGGLPVTTGDPPNLVPGMTMVMTDLAGRLAHLEVRPAEAAGASSTAPAPWPQLFEEAGLDLGAFKTVTPEWVPPAWGDAGAAWTGVDPANPDMPLRIEAAAYQGRPTFFRIAGPWTSRPGARPVPTVSTRVFAITMLTIVGFLVAFCVVLARRALMSGRADRRGATRLAAVAGTVQLIATLLSMAHVAHQSELILVMMALVWPLVVAVVVWVLYVALEPTIRRAWPAALISWTRLIDGRFRDPLVCRDILAGVGVTAVNQVVELLIAVTRGTTGIPGGLVGRVWGRVDSTRYAIAGTLNDFTGGVFAALVIVFLYALLRMALRRDWIAGLSIVGVFAAITFSVVPEGEAVFGAVASTIGVLSLVFLLIRFGLVAAATNMVTVGLVIFTLDLSAWYSTPSLLSLVTAVAIAVYAFAGYTRSNAVPRVLAR